ncbi:uncharacterized protein LOC18440637 isoform X1 [Amborella trichopoda]|nr:uncharacterized protein LOC18440637 isoform X1 [Amborella trichopoda]|eukprot:XP_006850838.2 uncharacterized protein LOC18440637 isoform X1 [Amborella trichopoda]
MAPNHRTRALSQPPNPTPTHFPNTFAPNDALLAWFNGEFAAANAIIDLLCAHLRLVSDRPSQYDSVLACINQRRLNWAPVLHMQKYFPITDVAFALQLVVNGRQGQNGDSLTGEVVDEEEEEEEEDGRSSSRGFQERKCPSENISIFSGHEDCRQRPARIKTTKGFIANELIKGHMVNVVKGLKLYENVFSNQELSSLAVIVNELHLAGQKGELLGETYIVLNRQLHANKREIIQLGVPIFGLKKEESARTVEPIPASLHAVIDHLVQWNLIPETARPNCCVINYFNEGDFSQPYLKPPHFDLPISTLSLSSECKMVFGPVLANDQHGNYNGSLMLSLKEGSLVVMTRHCAEIARHAICSSPTKRITITFLKVQAKPINQNRLPPLSQQASTAMAVALSQPGIPQLLPAFSAGPTPLGLSNVVPRWGVLYGPMIAVAHAPIAVGPTKGITRGGTGVFLPSPSRSDSPKNHREAPQAKGRMASKTPPTAPKPAKSDLDTGLVH